jgi:hypothetical protein
VIGARVAARTLALLRRDGLLFDRGVWASAARFILGKRGLVRTLGRDFLAFFRRDFHPWDRDDSELVRAWRKATSGAPAPFVTARRNSKIAPTPHRTGKIFEILDELGENCTMAGEFWQLDTGVRAHRAEYHHKDLDGYGAICTLLAERNVKFVPPPPRPEKAPPSRLVRARALAAVLRQKLRLEGVSWIVRNESWKQGTRVTRRACGGRVLTAEQTARVREAAKRTGVSVNSLLLHALNHAVTPLVARTSGRSRWGMPVNMRGPVRVEPEMANTSSIVSVEIADGASAKEVHSVVSDLFARKLDWGKWDQINLMMRLGERAARRKVREYYGNTAHPARIGVFSNLGQWSAESAADEGFLVFGTTTAVDPVFATAVSWNGRLSIALNVHPSLTESSPVVDGWVAAWLEAVLPGADGACFQRPVS